MPTCRIDQALIVAGASGAGKTTLLRLLAAGQLPQTIVAELPRGAERWPVVCAAHPEQWGIFDQCGESGRGLDGIAVHYDVTHAWHSHNRSYTRDPFWRYLRTCPKVTWLEIRPPRHRLIAQWCNARLGRPSVLRLRLWNLFAGSIEALLAAMRRLRRQTGTSTAPHWRYPRRLRFLKRIDLKLRHIASIPTSTLAFYRRSGRAEQMLDHWNEFANEMLGPRLVKRVALSPDQDSTIGRHMSWRVMEVAPYDRPAKAALSRQVNQATNNALGSAQT